MRRRRPGNFYNSFQVIVALFFVLAQLPGNSSWAAVYVVSNTLDSGAGSLRNQITAANANPGPDEIIFAISGPGPHTIQPLSALATVTDTLIIDGYTQAGASPATPTAPATMMIELDGQLAGAVTDGLYIDAIGCLVRGLVINRFSGWGISLVNIAEGSVIEGNYIGTDVSGTGALGNGLDGLHICEGIGHTIGGTASASRNIISGNHSGGIFFCPGFSTGGLVHGNYIGTDVTGTAALGNGSDGVLINTSGNAIGGIGSGEANVIAYNGGEGVAVSPGTVGNVILSNAIFSNDSLGINLGWDGVTLNDSCDLDTGANNLQNHPVLSLADPGPPVTLVDAFLNSTPNTTFRFEFFENSEQDSSGYGEGETFIGWADWTTDGAGNAFFTIFFDPPVPPGHCVTATATDPNNNTSEFSQVVYVGEGIALGGWIADGALQLEWTGLPGIAGYWLYGAENDAYFEPGLSPPFDYLMFELPPTVTTWPNLPAVGAPEYNFSYLIIAIGDYGQEIARSNRFGEWDFGLGGP